VSRKDRLNSKISAGAVAGAADFVHSPLRSRSAIPPLTLRSTPPHPIFLRPAHRSAPLHPSFGPLRSVFRSAHSPLTCSGCRRFQFTIPKFSVSKYMYYSDEVTGRAAVSESYVFRGIVNFGIVNCYRYWHGGRVCSLMQAWFYTGLGLCSCDHLGDRWSWRYAMIWSRRQCPLVNKIKVCWQLQDCFFLTDQ